MHLTATHLNPILVSLSIVQKWSVCNPSMNVCRCVFLMAAFLYMNYNMLNTLSCTVFPPRCLRAVLIPLELPHSFE